MNLTKGFQNLFSPTLANFLIVLSLVIIVILVYIKTKKIDLFDADADFIERIKKEQEQKNKFAVSLAIQEQTIQKLQSIASNIFSSI